MRVITMKLLQHRLLVGLLLAVVHAAGCMRNPVTGKTELSLIGTEREVAIGLQSAPQFEGEFGGKLANSQLQGYLQEVGARLAAVSDRQDVTYEYSLLSSEVPNGFALPGGKIYITAGLMSQMSNERQLAAVLAHETVHVAARDSVNGLQRELGKEILIEVASAAAGESGQTAHAVGQVVGSMVNMKYSRNRETRADEFGVRYMVKANYNPWGMVELLELLDSMSQSGSGGLGELFSSHPSTSRRVEDAKDVIRKEYKDFSRETPDPRAAQFMQMRRLLEAEMKR